MDENNAPEGQAPENNVQAPTAPAAPVAPEAQAPAAEPPVIAPPENHPTIESSADEDGVITFAPTGDAALDVSLTFLGNLGFAGDDPAMVAAASGDFALLEAKLAVLGDKAAGWQQMVNLAKDAHARSAKAVADQVAASSAAVLAVAGSKENWSNIVSWAAKNADPAEKTAINQMIDAGPVQARAAATLLLNAYNAANGNVVKPRNPARDPSGAAPSGTGKLSPSEYSAAVQELHNRLGYGMEQSPEYADLRRRLAV